MAAILLGIGGHGFHIIMGGNGFDIIGHRRAWAKAKHIGIWKGSLNALIQRFRD